jgi:hypothetical protein
MLENGKIKEKGSYEELTNKKSHFAEFMESFLNATNSSGKSNNLKFKLILKCFIVLMGKKFI